MNIRIVAVGKIKEKYIQEGIKEFTKRLSRYCSLDIIEIDDEKAPENLSEKEMEIVKTKDIRKDSSKFFCYCLSHRRQATIIGGAI
jgi:23S rRNA (pseudouridine1915-N3)-methyltransferase